MDPYLPASESYLQRSRGGPEAENIANFRSKYLFFNVIRFLLSTCLRYPSFISIKQLFHMQTSPATLPLLLLKNEILLLDHSELEECKTILKEPKSSYTTLVILVYCYYLIKNSYYIIWSAHTYPLQWDFFVAEHSANVDGWTQLACLKTNCTTMGGDSDDGESHLSRAWKEPILNKLLLLPSFRICLKKLALIYPPATDIGFLALFVYPSSNAILFTAGLLLPLIYWIIPTFNASIMFVLSPKLTRRLFVTKSRGFIRDLNESFVNFLHVDLSSVEHESHPKLVNYHLPSIYIRQYPCKRKLNPSSILPSIRTEWWRYQIVGAYRACYLFVIGGFVGFLVGSLLSINYFKAEKQALMIRFQEIMKASGCSMWIADDLGIIGEEIDLSRVDLSWKLIATLETLLLVITCSISLAAIIACYYLTVCELNCWLNELKESTKLLVELTSLLPEQSRKRETTMQLDLLQATEEALVEISESVGRSFRGRTHFKFGLLLITQKVVVGDNIGTIGDLFGSSLNTKVFYQMRSLSLVNLALTKVGSDPSMNAIDRDSVLEATISILMDRLYLSYHLFMDLVRHASKSIGALIILSNLMIYCLVVGAVIYSRYIANFSTFLFFYLIVCLSAVNLYMYHATNFHSNVSELNFERFTSTDQYGLNNL